MNNSLDDLSRYTNKVEKSLYSFLRSRDIYGTDNGINISFHHGHPRHVSVWAVLYKPVEYGPNNMVILERKFFGEIPEFISLFSIVQLDDIKKLTIKDLWEHFNQGNITLKCIAAGKVHWFQWTDGAAGKEFQFYRENYDFEYIVLQRKDFSSVADFWKFTWSYAKNTISVCVT